MNQRRITIKDVNSASFSFGIICSNFKDGVYDDRDRYLRELASIYFSRLDKVVKEYDAVQDINPVCIHEIACQNLKDANAYIQEGAECSYTSLRFYVEDEIDEENFIDDPDLLY